MAQHEDYRLVYDRLHQLEEHDWWYAARRRVVFGFIEQLARTQRLARVLDAGCGTGYNLGILKNYADEVMGLEISEDAIRFARERQKGAPLTEPIVLGSFPDDVPFPEEHFNLIISLDVLEHIAEDVRSLMKFRRLLAQDGILLLTVPAFQFLWSEHDEFLHHKRRYDKRSLRAALEEADFSVTKLTYFNAIPFLPVVLFRGLKKMLRKKGQAPRPDRVKIPRPINFLAREVLSLEAGLLKYTNLPFGVSLLAVAQKR